MTDLPVVVVGGGPVGMTTGLLLAKYEVPVVILEASPQRDPIGSKALCMQRDVLDVLERVGCGDVLVEEGVTWTLGRTYWRNHELFQITFPELGENHYPPFVNIGQDRTEYWLERAVDADPFVELRYRHQVTGLTQSTERVELECEAAGAPKTIAADYVIGADGSRSAVRKFIGATFDGRSFDDKFLICDIHADLGFANERRFFFDPEWNPDRQVLIHPQANSVWRIDWQVPPHFDLDEEERSGGLETRIRKIVGDGDYEIVWKSVYRFHQRIASTFRNGRVFLAGDAAHIVAPFGARGLNSGIQDAENLAWKLAFMRKGWAADELLDSYHEERRAAAEENLRITGATMDFLVPPTAELWAKRRRTLEEAVDDPNAEAAVDSGQLAEPHAYTDSSLTTPDSAERTIAAGTLLPDAPVKIAAHPEVRRTRQLFGRGFVVLCDGPLCDVRSPLAGDAPIEAYELGAIDSTGIVGEVLALPEGWAVVVRPDGHVAATVPGGEPDIQAAILRASALSRRDR